MESGTSTLHRDLVSLSQAVLAISGEQELERVLQHIVDQARSLIGARYGALGVPEPDGTPMARLLVSGMTDEEQERIGALPVGRGLLGVVLREGVPVRLADIAADPRSVGFPPHHPAMRSLLGVPIRRGDEVLGDLYLTDKVDLTDFSEADQALLEVLAEHAALAIVNARLRGQLQRSEERYRTLTESAPEIVFALDELGQITFVNDRIREVTGHALQLFLGRFLRALVVAEDRPLVDIHLQAMRLGAPRTSFPVRAVDAGGKLRHFEVSLVPGPGRESGFQGIAQDVTDRHTLAREMADRTNELVSTREEREQLRAFVSLIIQAQEDERARIAGDLHDTTVQTLTAIARRLHALAGEGAADSAVLGQELDVLASAAQNEADEVRRLSRNLRPSVLDHLGLAAGLEQLAADMRLRGLQTHLEVVGNASQLPDHARTALFRIAQEALTNVRRHSGASKVDMQLLLGAQEAELHIRDDGHGFDPDLAAGTAKRASTSLGLMGMRERAAILGGSLKIESAEGQGTTVVARLPL